MVNFRPCVCQELVLSLVLSVCILPKDFLTELERFVCRGSDRFDLVCLLMKKVYPVNVDVCGPVEFPPRVIVREAARDAMVRTMALLRLDSASELREWN